ncbi:MAG TPA: hypothetical protein VFV57_06010 [Limnobacter sp.]|nr:hypothetical protein [Limnobacter sp.]
MSTTEQLNRWRHLIEPAIQESITPMPWAEVCSLDVSVLEGKASVLVACDSNIGGKPVRSIWVAAGVLDEVLELVERACAQARRDGHTSICYIGRRGWVKTAGFSELAIVGIRSL